MYIVLFKKGNVYKYEKMIHGNWINMARNEKYEIIGPKEVLVKFEMI